MATLSNLVGAHVFSIVPLVAAHPFDGDASGVAFTLDGITYLAFEDPSDGYRSSLGALIALDGEAYLFGGNTYPDYIKEDVLCSHVTKGEYGGEDDILEVRSVRTGAVIFRVGTSNVDDYYPSFVNEWHPEGLSANQAGAS